VIIYLLSLHFTILTPPLKGTIINLGVTFLAGFGAVLFAQIAAQQRAAKFISHYKLVRLLGEGGMGRVYKATDTQTKRPVAIKILHESLVQDPKNSRRLSAEGRLLSSISHPNIVKIYEFGETETRTYLAMEYLDGGTLTEYLHIHHPLPLKKILSFSQQIGNGLSAIHSQEIIHRDLKTGNIMIGADGMLRIMDFGLSKAPLVTTMTSLGTIVGTLGYVAPEQITNMGVDHRVDIFSFGVIIFELCYNSIPFQGENEMAVIHAIFNKEPEFPDTRQDIPVQLQSIIKKCLRKEPGARYQNVSRILDQFAEISGEIAIPNDQSPV